jgi:hypothetical protein
LGLWFSIHYIKWLLYQQIKDRVYIYWGYDKAYIIKNGCYTSIHRTGFVSASIGGETPTANFAMIGRANPDGQSVHDASPVIHWGCDMAYIT